MRITSSDSGAEDDPPVQKTQSHSGNTANAVKPSSAVKPSPSFANVLSAAKQSSVVNSAAAKKVSVANSVATKQLPAANSAVAKQVPAANSTAAKQVTVANSASTSSVKPVTVSKLLSVTKTSNPVQNNTATVSKVTIVGDKDKTFSMSQSVSVKSVPPTPSTSSATANNAPASKSIPNLPKGLVITQVGNSSNSKSSDSEDETNNTSSTPSSVTSASETAANFPATFTRIVTSSDTNHKKSAQVVRIQSTNGVSASKPSDSSSSSQSLPKGVTLTPVASSSASDVPKPKNNSKGKRKKDERDDEDDEEYGNDLIYDSDDSDFEESNLTQTHSAVLKYFQDSTAEELMGIPGCSKKKVDSILNARPFQNWGDLVRLLFFSLLKLVMYLC